MDVQTAPVEASKPEARPALPNPQPIQTSPFKWNVLVVTKDDAGNWIVTNPPKNIRDTQPYYVITPEAYEVLARNMADIIRWVKEAQWRLDYYRGEGNLDGNKVPAQ